MVTSFECLKYRNGTLWILDQRRLPQRKAWLRCRRHSDVIRAIKTLAIRGAPAIGVAAAYGMVLGAQRFCSGKKKVKPERIQARMKTIARDLAASRPTAVNLFHALEHMEKAVESLAEQGRDATDVWLKVLHDAAVSWQEKENRCDQLMAQHGWFLVPEQGAVLTICNTGTLATTGWGTALGVLRFAHRRGKKIHVFVVETRPLLQGARLTCWELVQEGVPHTLIVDGAAAWIMKEQRVKAVFAGADRIAANGDTANKIGTRALAVAARHHNIPFYIVAPTSTLDLLCAEGDAIPIERRSPDEIKRPYGRWTAPRPTAADNPAFDVTEHELITAIVTENGVCRSPFHRSLRRIMSSNIETRG